MAKMRPTILPEDIKKEPMRMAEILVFEALQKLPNSFHVLYGVNWYIKKRNNSWVEGEADFVVISPSVGMVVIEVKGGQIGRDEESWYSIDRFGEKHLIKDPSLQASTCKHFLLQYIKENVAFNNRKLPARHMVCFPNILSKDFPNIIELPKEMQILADDLSDIQIKLENFARREYNGEIAPLSSQECSELVNILKPNFECPSRWSLQIERQNKIIDSLTKDQVAIWDLIGENQRVALSGPAGSGKTILALKLAKKYIADKKNVLVLVPGASLKTYYTESLGPEVYVYSYTAANTLHTPSFVNFDLVIIDEAQDINEDLWLALYELYNIDKCSSLLVLFDSNQMLKNTYNTNPFESLFLLRLTKVIRNTKQIAKFTDQFYSGQISLNAVGPDGLRVDYTACKPEDNFNVILKLINKYIKEDGFNYSDIVVLFGQNRRRKFVIESLEQTKNKYGISFRKLQSVNGSLYKHPYIVAETIYNYRGLESKVVILCDINCDDILQLKNECYIGASRAKNILHIVADDETLSQIRFN